MGDEMQNNPKFYVSNKIGFDNWPDFGEGNYIKFDPNKKMASVYEIWGTEGYIPYVYHSIISQIMYTDVEEMANIFIFIDDVRYEYVSWLFRNILDSKNIIKVSTSNAVKYMITCHPILENYEIVTFIDTDMFFWSPSSIKYDFYKLIEKHFIENNNSVLLLKNGLIPVNDVLWHRKEVICGEISNEDFIKLIIDGTGMEPSVFEDWLYNDRWCMSGIFSYNKNTFSDPSYQKYVANNLFIEQKCDETVWNSWIKSKGIKPIDIKEGTGFGYTLYLDDDINHYMDNNESLYLLHPIIGQDCINDKAYDLLNKIREEFKIFLNNI